MAESITPTENEEHLFDGFKKNLKDLKKAQHQANNATNYKTNPSSSKETQKQVYRDNIVALFAVWEGYVSEVLKVGFRKLVDRMVKLTIEELRQNDNRERLLRQILQERHRSLDLSRYEHEHDDSWKDELQEYSKTVTSNISISPVFAFPKRSGDRSINQVFGKLFLIDKDVAEEMVESPGIQIGCIVRFEGPDRPTSARPLNLASANALSHMSRFYYGARNVFAHGDNQRTFGKKGVLHEFPDTIDDLKSILGTETDGMVLNDLERLITRLRDDGKQAKPNFSHVVTFQRYLEVIASKLANSMRKLVFDSYGLTIWEEVQEPSFI